VSTFEIILRVSGALAFIFAGYRLGVWRSRKTLDQVMERQLASRGFAPSEEFVALLRRPTVDGVARRVVKKMGLCATSDITLSGTTITMVCHDKALLQRAAMAIHGLRRDVEGAMVRALLAKSAEEDKAKATKPATLHAMDEMELPLESKVFKGPAKPELKVLDGGKK
jgi:hypothetical protein